MKPVLVNPRAWQILLAGYWLTLFVLSHLPASRVVTSVAGSDKLAHLLAFAVLSALLATTWQLSAGHLSLAQLGWVWVAVIVYAAFDEWTQSFVGRQTSLRDWLADAAGGAIGLAVFISIRRAFRNRPLDENRDGI